MLRLRKGGVLNGRTFRGFSNRFSAFLRGFYYFEREERHDQRDNDEHSLRGSHEIPNGENGVPKVWNWDCVLIDADNLVGPDVPAITAGVRFEIIAFGLEVKDCRVSRRGRYYVSNSVDNQVIRVIKVGSENDYRTESTARRSRANGHLTARWALLDGTGVLPAD